MGVCGEPLCPCRQIKTPEPAVLAGAAEPKPSQLSDHELRWAIRDGIARMYEHLNLELQKEEE